MATGRQWIGEGGEGSARVTTGRQGVLPYTQHNTENDIIHTHTHTHTHTHKCLNTTHTHNTTKDATIIHVNAMACVVDVDQEAATIIEPTNHYDAVNDQEYGVEWEKAEKQQLRELLENKTFKEVKISSLPMGTRIISGRWVYKVKPDENDKVAVFKA